LYPYGNAYISCYVFFTSRSNIYACAASNMALASVRTD